MAGAASHKERQRRDRRSRSQTSPLCDAELGSDTDDVMSQAGVGLATGGRAGWRTRGVACGWPHRGSLLRPAMRAPCWVEQRDWWFRAEVPASPLTLGGRTQLLCRGLDTVADLWLDDQPLGHSQNMFRPASFDVTGRLSRQRSCSSASGRHLPGLLHLRGRNQPAAAPRRRVGGAIAPEEPPTKAREYGRRPRWRPYDVRPPFPGAGTSGRDCPRSDTGSRRQRRDT